MNMIKKEDWESLTESLGKVSHDFVPEQERNFDAEYIPEPSTHKFVGKEFIAGKWYKVYQ